MALPMGFAVPVLVALTLTQGRLDPVPKTEVLYLTYRDRDPKGEKPRTVKRGEEILVKLRYPQGVAWDLDKKILGNAVEVVKLWEEMVPVAPALKPQAGGDLIFVGRFKAVKAGAANIKVDFTYPGGKPFDSWRVQIKVE